MKFFSLQRSLLLLLLIFLNSKPTGIIRAEKSAAMYNESWVQQEKNKWVDSVYQALNEDQRIGQFFMTAVYSKNDATHKQQIINQINNYHIGGLIFMQGSPGKELNWTNQFQEISKVPLLISIDGEWGLSMRLDSSMQFPKQLTLGAIQDNELIYEMGREIGRQCKRIGINVNFAPVADVNVNPKNPVINDRSFGENKINVAAKAISYAEGLQKENVMACAKHFPGHGDTEADSHYDLPLITKSRTQLEQTELYPFRLMINNGIQSVMAAHLSIPALDSSKNIPSSLSRPIVTHLLKDSLGFKGLVFSDALNMQGVAKYFPAGETDKRAFIAGNDILLFSQDVPTGISKIKAAIAAGEIDAKEVERRCKAVLAAKWDLGLYEKRKLSGKNLYSDLHNSAALALNRKLYASAITIAANSDSVLPYAQMPVSEFASVSIGENGQNTFQNTLTNYGRFTHFQISKDATAAEYVALESKLAKYPDVVVSFHGMYKSASKNYGIPQNGVDLVNRLQKTKRVTTVLFGSPYALKYFGESKQIIVAYEDNEITRSYAAQAIFGGIGCKGKLPVSASEKFKSGIGFNTKAIRIEQGIPEDQGFIEEDFKPIDSLVLYGIQQKAFPGAQLVIARKGMVLYNKSFGKFTYGGNRDVLPSDLYDVASLTKVLSTTNCVMKLYEEKKINLLSHIGQYIKTPLSVHIADTDVKDFLLHQAGLQPFIPFIKYVRRDTAHHLSFSTLPTRPESAQLAGDLYLNGDYEGLLWESINNAEVGVHKYKYSDLSMYLLKQMVEDVSQDNIKNYWTKHFLQAMGLQYMCYQPSQKFPIEQIAPTEYDSVMRRGLIQGYVHDPGAALLGGIAGHAGVFSNAFDVAQMAQMWLNGGSYAGKQILEPSTIAYFSQAYSTASRRGLGFDKPEPDENLVNPCADVTPLSTFGHTGFTGTCVWADPSNQLIFVFLSNRTYPIATENKLSKLGTRSNIQQELYAALANRDGNTQLRVVE